MQTHSLRERVLSLLGWIALACCPVELAAATSAPPATQPSVAAIAPHPDLHFHVDMRKAVGYLASDELEGRRVGTPGLQKAADYIADAFSKLGLRTVPGFDGYFQPFKMVTRVDPDPTKTSLAINTRQLKLGDDYLPLRASADGPAKGPVVFAGYGISDPARHYDDYANLDAKGKIVLVMRFEPQDKDGKSRFADKDNPWSTDATIPQKVQAAIDHGAIGVLLVNPAMHHDDEGLISFRSSFPFGSKVPLMQVTVGAADAMLKQGGLPDLKALQSTIDSDLTPDGAALKGVAAKLAFAIHRTEAQVENVAALLPGEGPHANEYVVIGAHYDHLGHGGPGSLAPWSHGIHHGADDNASGTSAMLELADRFARLGAQPRSLIFIAFTGEEEGLIGSSYFVSHPPIPLNEVAAMLNLDMVGRVSKEKLLLGGEGTAANFPELVRKADEGLTLKLGEFEKGGFGPSDHMSFARKKIPVLFFFSGLHLDYHRPTDTADKINYKGMGEVVDLGVKLIEELATMPRQQYDGRYDAQSMLHMAGIGASGSTHGGSASFGTIPDYSQPDDSKDGMRVGGVVPGSPADKLGIKEGDMMVNFNGTPIGNKMDYTMALGNAKPGQTVTIQLKRAAKPIEVEATLGARKSD
jgi:hypothetical protein